VTVFVAVSAASGLPQKAVFRAFRAKQAEWKHRAGLSVTSRRAHAKIWLPLNWKMDG